MQTTQSVHVCTHTINMLLTAHHACTFCPHPLQREVAPPKPSWKKHQQMGRAGLEPGSSSGAPSADTTVQHLLYKYKHWGTLSHKNCSPVLQKCTALVHQTPHAHTAAEAVSCSSTGRVATCSC